MLEKKFFFTDFDAEYSSDDDISSAEVNKDLRVNPCLNEFTSYRDQKMKKVDGETGVYKVIIKEGFAAKMDLDQHKVSYEYDLYLEDKELPMDSNWLTKKFGVIHESKGICVLPGLTLAIASMKYEEVSLFWISHELMYGQFGMCDKIPPKADIVARIKICKLFGNDGKTEIKPVLTGYEATIRAAKKTIAKGKILFDRGSIDAAIMTYVKCVNDIEKLHLGSEEEEKQTKEFLIKVYLNLCVCYVKNQNPQNCCLAMRQLERLKPIKNNPKALYTKARALIMLDDFVNAEIYLNKAQKLEPGNKSILAAFDDIKKLRKVKKDYQEVVTKIEHVLNKDLNENSTESRLNMNLLK